MHPPLNTIIHGECLEKLRLIDDNTFDSCVTDPPYGIGFMGKEWDTFKGEYLEEKAEIEEKRRPRSDGRTATGFQNAVYAGNYDLSLSGNQKFQQWFYEISLEIYRVLKPGGYFLSFCGPRTYHRMASAIEDSGFEIRDQVQWLFASGFPKSLNIEKNGAGDAWQGWGTALKPANEPVCVARKPLSEKTVAANVLRWGTGAINIDECRIPLNGEQPPSGSDKRVFAGNAYADKESKYGTNTTTSPLGRFPSNVILDEEAAAMLDEQTGELSSGIMKSGTNRTSPFKTRGDYGGKFPEEATPQDTYGDTGGASRFFYCAKTSRFERNKGLENFNSKRTDQDKYRPHDDGAKGIQSRLHGATERGGNHHPTVKPIDLMRYLVRLVTPPKGHCLDPFGGSGTTGIACKLERINYTIIEREEEYCKISEARIAAWHPENPQAKLYT